MRNYTISFKFCTQFNFWKQCSSHVVSLLYLIRSILLVQKALLSIYDLNYIPSSLILLKLCTQAHCRWEVISKYFQGRISSEVESRNDIKFFCICVKWKNIFFIKIVLLKFLIYILFFLVRSQFFYCDFVFKRDFWMQSGPPRWRCVLFLPLLHRRGIVMLDVTNHKPVTEKILRNLFVCTDF